MKVLEGIREVFEESVTGYGGDFGDDGKVDPRWRTRTCFMLMFFIEAEPQPRRERLLRTF